MAHKLISPKNQPQFFRTTIRQYWLGKTKPKEVFPKHFQQVATEFFLFNGIFY